MKSNHTRWAGSLKGEDVITSDPKLPIFESIDAGTYLPRLPDEFFDDLCQTSDYSITELTQSAAEKFEEYRRASCQEVERMVSQKQSQLITRMKLIHQDIDSRIQLIRRKKVSKKEKKDTMDHDEDGKLFPKRTMNDSAASARAMGALGASLARTHGEHFPGPSHASTQQKAGIAASPELITPAKPETQTKVGHKVKFVAEEELDTEFDEAGTHDDVFNIDEDLDHLDSSVQPFSTSNCVEDVSEDRIVKDESVGLLHSGIAASFSAIPTTLKSQEEMQNENQITHSDLQGPYDTKDSDTGVRSMATRRDNHMPTMAHAEPDEDMALVGAVMANAPSHRHSLARSASIRFADGRKTSQHAQDFVESSKLARSVPSTGAIQIRRGNQNSDMKEGLEREPKTSLPYNEKLFVPSLLKATQGRRTQKDSVAGAASVSQKAPATSNIRKTGFRISSSQHATPSRELNASNTLQNTSMNGLPPLPDVPSQHIRLEQSTTLFPHAVPGTEHIVQQEDTKAVSKLLYFTHYLQNLKLSKRTGWYHHNVPFPESIADHMYRMAVLSILIDSDGIDFRKCSIMALVHDMAEALVGDLTPLCKVDKEEKRRREVQAIHFLTNDLLGNSQASRRIYDLWHEYEERSTPEAKLVKDLDCFELCLQAYEYERTHNITDLQPFWDGAAPKVSNPEVQRWMGALLNKREAMWTSRGMNYRLEA